MALIDDVKTVCDRLAPRGWRQLLRDVTSDQLDISQSSASKLRNELIKPVTVDRTVTGFEDFRASANRGATAGKPSHSLLYHALASPNVHPTSDGDTSGVQKDYPTLDELEIIENFIYGMASDRTDLDDTFIAVFSYQYRAAGRTSHLRHADLAFSRTGVARVGTAKYNYDGSRRSFWVVPAGGGDSLPVLPARYGVFLARRSRAGSAGSVQGGADGTDPSPYIFPVHKLFAGNECLKGKTLTVDFLEFHRNEKLRKTHSLPVSEGGLPVPAGFDVSKLPYVRDSTNGGKLASLKSVGSSVLVVPKHGSTLIRTVTQKNSVSRKKEIVHFQVPARFVIDRMLGPFSSRRSTRFAESTLEIPAHGADRLAPEYVNIRHKVDPSGPPSQTPTDLNELGESDFDEAMRDGGYAAAHFTDDSCDGCVEAVVTGLDSALENLLAFSLITAPDFFPLADQSEVETDPTISQAQPLSKGRLPVNPSLPRPSAPASFAFSRNDTTVTAVVGQSAVGTRVAIIGRENRMVSFLPDSASNVFAPGWDTSRSTDGASTFLTSSGLGSPFPEDAKLCAALMSFWPAVAPDTTRTFGSGPSQLPMLDAELGFHPKHSRVASGDVSSYRGWDGEYGPFLERVSGNQHVNFVAIKRSDYVKHSLANRIRVSLTAEVQSEELIARHQAYNACEAAIRPSTSEVCLVVFRKVDDWAAFGAAHSEITGAGYLLEFAELTGSVKSTPELDRVRQRVRKIHVCQFADRGIAYKNGGTRFRFIPN